MPDFTVEQNAGFVTHADPGDDGDGPLTVRGIALGEGIAKGKTSDGEDEPSYYPPEVLQEAADDLVGKKIVDDTNHDDLESLQPPNEAIVGEVTDARHKDGVGLAFEGQIHREPERSLVEAGLMDVSPSVWRAHDEYDEDLGGRPVEKIGWWRDLAVVNSGGSPASTIEASSTAAEALQAEAGSDALDADMVGEALAETFDESGAHAGGGGDTNPGGGESPGRKMPDDDDPSDNPGGDPSVEELRAELKRLREENEDLRSQLDDDKEEKIETLEARIDELEDENESLESDVEPVEDAAAEALSEQTGLSEDMVRQRWDGAGDMISTLTEGQDTPDDVGEVLQFTPNPQSGDPSPTDPGGDGGGLADLSNDEREEVESLMKRAETFDGVNDQVAESLRSDAADLADVEDADELVGEVV